MQASITVSVIKQVQETYENISLHLNDHRRGEILRDGCRIAILGAPNAGKVGSERCKPTLVMPTVL